MYQVIYDISQSEYQYFNGVLIFPTILLIIMVGTLFLVIDRYKNRKKKSVYRGIIFILLLIYPFKFSSKLYFNEFQKLNNLQLKVNQSKEVVGEIKDFIPLSERHKQPCTFKVNGIFFQLYPPSRTGALTYTSYPLKNGQKVRIKYLYDANWKMNLILKFEVEEDRGATLKPEVKGYGDNDNSPLIPTASVGCIREHNQ